MHVEDWSDPRDRRGPDGPYEPMGRREFCRLTAIGVLGLGASALLGCARVRPTVSTDAKAPRSATSSHAKDPSSGVIENTDRTLELPGLHASGIHPGFIDFLSEHGLPSWGGYRYWLCWTPYDNLSAELPCLAASNDLVKWVTPLGLPNPITGSFDNGQGSVAVCNDPEICFDPAANCIHLFHGVYSGGTLFPDPADGTFWGGGLFCYRIHEDGTIQDRLFDQGRPFTSCRILGLTGGSVTVHRSRTGMWHMWEAGISHRTSTDGLIWTDAVPCTVGTPDAFRSTTLPSYLRGWKLDHAGGKFNPVNGRMELAVSCTPPGRTGGQGQNLAMIACDMSEPTAMYVMLDTWLLKHRKPTQDWDGGSTYRSVLMPHPNKPHSRRLIYSAFREPVADYPTPNAISTVVEGDISAHLLTAVLPHG